MRVPRVTPQQWLTALFALLFLAFLTALLVEPTVGRGGR